MRFFTSNISVIRLLTTFASKIFNQYANNVFINANNRENNVPDNNYTPINARVQFITQIVQLRVSHEENRQFRIVCAKSTHNRYPWIYFRIITYGVERVIIQLLLCVLRATLYTKYSRIRMHKNRINKIARRKRHSANSQIIAQEN